MQVAFELVEDRSTAEAILSGPTLALTGLTPDQSALTRKQYLQTHFGDQLQDLDSEHSDIEAVAAAVEIVRKKLLAASEKSEQEFPRTVEGIRGDSRRCMSSRHLVLQTHLSGSARFSGKTAFIKDAARRASLARFLARAN